MDLAVETRGLTRDFGDFRAVDGIDLAVPAGSFYGFLGPNGAGKSTTIKCLTGLLRPSGGTMRILGIDPLADPVAVKRRIGVVPEDLALFDRLTARRNADFVAQVHGIDDATARSRAGRSAGAHGSEGGGQHARRRFLARHAQEAVARRRAAARAAAALPRRAVRGHRRGGVAADQGPAAAFVARGGTIFLTSHILEIVERLSTHIGVIARGRMVAQGPIDELRAGATAARASKSCSSSWSAATRRVAGRARLDLMMLRILRAFAWMRWRVLLNSLERTGARDTLERFSLAIEQLGPIVAVAAARAVVARAVGR